MGKRKVFCIGLHKTGTTSFKNALERVDYRVATWFGVEDPLIRWKAESILLKLAHEFDAAQDDPWYMFFRELDKEFPGSKFVLTVRESDEWFNSCEKHFKDRTNFIREWFYGEGLGAPVGNREHWITRKQEHEASVREYFKGRDEDFLEMDITKGDGWEVLGPFLCLNNNLKVFPKMNAAISREQEGIYLKYKISKGAKRLFYRVLMKLNRIFFY